MVTALTAATPTTPASVTVSPGGTLAPWTCALREGADTTGVIANTTTVKMKCRVKNGVLTAKRLRTTDDTTGRVKIEATGLVTAFTAAGTTTTPTTPATPAVPATPKTPAPSLFDKSGDDPTTPATPADPAAPGTTTTTAVGSITVNPGNGLAAVTCSITDRTRLRGLPVVGTDTAKLECKSYDDALVAKKIKVKGQKSGSRHGDRGDDHKGRR